MIELQSMDKITPEHLKRKAIVYLRQSSDKQVRENLESKRLQYAMADRARSLGFGNIDIIDTDLGSSASIGADSRKGFDNTIGLIARGEVGIIMSREVSRLSRTDKDWCRLLEVCQIFDTLVGDEQKVYDLSSLDDQLVLGIKGTLSVVELKMLKFRLQQGQEAKARRGELFKRLPAGYAQDSDGKVTIHPNKRVREAIDMVFEKFRRLWSVRQTFTWFRDHDIELPVNPVHGNRLVWQIPTQGFIRDVLKNPFYAGAYVWGRRPVETIFVDGQLKKRMKKLVKPEECRVFIPDHHPGYIDWETYEENQNMISRNTLSLESDETLSAIRAGQGLLSGLLRCGHCGRKLHIRYWGGRGTNARYLCKGDFDAGGDYCIGFGGGLVDRRISHELLKVLSPLGVAASLRAIEELNDSEDTQYKALCQQLKQLEYEAQRAFEQYDVVDPRNRLVAEELEHRWNNKLMELEKVKMRISEPTMKQRPLDDEDKERITAMGQSFEGVWHSEHCPPELKKKLLRTAIEEIIVTQKSEMNILDFVIHWKGGTHTHIEMERPKSGTAQKTSLDSLEIIRKMAVRYGDDQIASVLNRLGHRTGKGKRWNQNRIKTARRNHSITGQKRMTPDPKILTLSQAAKYCGVSHRTIERLVEAGLLKRDQVAPRAPWEIRIEDLDDEPVHGILDHLKQTGKLVLSDRGDLDRQTSLFAENKRR
jgi:DNA invertase Pin-like site-specific DNA recombinase